MSGKTSADEAQKSRKDDRMTVDSPVVHLIGLPTDSHSSFLRGAADAPAAIRVALRSEHGNTSAENGLELGLDIVFDDQGDVQITETAEDYEVIRRRISE